MNVGNACGPEMQNPEEITAAGIGNLSNQIGLVKRSRRHVNKTMYVKSTTKF